MNSTLGSVVPLAMFFILLYLLMVILCGTDNKFANKLGKDQVISDTAVIAVFMVTILLLLFCYCCCFKALPISVAKIR